MAILFDIIVLVLSIMFKTYNVTYLFIDQEKLNKNKGKSDQVE